MYLYGSFRLIACAQSAITVAQNQDLCISSMLESEGHFVTPTGVASTTSTCIATCSIHVLITSAACIALKAWRHAAAAVGDRPGLKAANLAESSLCSDHRIARRTVNLASAHVSYCPALCRNCHIDAVQGRLLLLSKGTEGVSAGLLCI